MTCDTVVRHPQRLTKDRAKALVAAGLQRASAAHGVDEVALAAGCSTRCIEKALAHDSLPGIDLLANALDRDPHILDELLAAKGLRIVPLHAQAANDLATMAGLCDAAGEIGRAIADGQRDHRETLTVADKVRPFLPALQAIVREADVLRGAA